MTPVEFAQLLQRINPGRASGQATAPVCAAWREGGEVQRVIEALLGWEVAERRIATPGDLRAIAERAATNRARLAESAGEEAA